MKDNNKNLLISCLLIIFLIIVGSYLSYKYILSNIIIIKNNEYYNDITKFTKEEKKDNDSRIEFVKKRYGDEITVTFSNRKPIKDCGCKMNIDNTCIGSKCYVIGYDWNYSVYYKDLDYMKTTITYNDFNEKWTNIDYQTKKAIEIGKFIYTLRENKIEYKTFDSHLVVIKFDNNMTDILKSYEFNNNESYLDICILNSQDYLEVLQFGPYGYNTCKEIYKGLKSIGDYNSIKYEYIKKTNLDDEDILNDNKSKYPNYKKIVYEFNTINKKIDIIGLYQQE